MIRVAKVQSEPEAFMLVELTSDAETILRTSARMLSAVEVSTKLHKAGVPGDEIKALIENARKSPIGRW